MGDFLDSHGIFHVQIPEIGISERLEKNSFLFELPHFIWLHWLQPLFFMRKVGMTATIGVIFNACSSILKNVYSASAFSLQSSAFKKAGRGE
jgi:hypothetical protein